jgi:hypothetical protein
MHANTGRRKWQALLLTATTVVALVLGANSAANAAPQTPVVSGGTPITLTVQEETDIAAEIGSTDTEALVFDADAAAQGGATSQSIADYAAVLESAGWTVIGTVNAAPSAGSSRVAALAARCSGSNGYHGYYVPWGYQFGANSCNTSKVIAAAGLGTAGAGAVTAALVLIGVGAVAAPIAGLVAAVIGFGAAALATCQAFSSNGGIWLNIGGYPAASCWGQ